MKKKVISATVLLVFVCLLATSGFAANGEPLTLESSHPANGAIDVSTDLEEIELMFSKNVVNMAVAENNQTCIDFVDADNNPVAFELIMADDQVDREKRDYLFLRPEAALSEGTTYLVKISKDLTSKSGAALQEDLEVSFTTLGARPVVAQASNESTNEKSMGGLVWLGILCLFGASYLMFSSAKKS